MLWRLLDNSHQEKIAQKNAEIARLKAQIASKCDSDDSSSEYITQPPQIVSPYIYILFI